MNQTGVRLDTGGLDGRNLELVESLADDIKPAGARRITEFPILLLRERRADCRRQGLFPDWSVRPCARPSSAAMAPM
jgi:hypothetical protein